MDNGDLLFFDNGNMSDILYNEDNPISRIRRIRVIDNSYCETLWQYDLPPNLHGLGMGSVQLLDNDNYFTMHGPKVYKMARKKVYQMIQNISFPRPIKMNYFENRI